jgi:hypothetical protein
MANRFPDLNLCDCCIWGVPEDLVVRSSSQHKKEASIWILNTRNTDRAKSEHSERIGQSLMRQTCSNLSYTFDHVLEHADSSKQTIAICSTDQARFTIQTTARRGGVRTTRVL